jgi:hypothetical protein
MIQTHRDDRRQAYQMGYSDSIALTTDEIRAYTRETPGADEPETAVTTYFDGFTSGARWSNTVLPRLRDIAGYSDSMGVGTYTDGSAECSERLDELVRAYRDGWVDKSLGYDRYSSRPHLKEEEEAA